MMTTNASRSTPAFPANAHAAASSPTTAPALSSIRPAVPPDLPLSVDVAVVGGGLAGLAATVTAVQAGRSVLLLEQSSGLGGRAQTRQDDGFAFNIGPHALYEGSPGLRVLRDLGVTPNAAKVGVGGATLLHDGRLHPLAADAISLLTSKVFGWRTKFELAMFLGSLSRLDSAPLDGITLDAWLGSALRTQRARQLVRALIRTSAYANDPARLSAGAGLRQLKTSLGGALYVHGGWQTVVDGLLAQAEASGAQVVSGARVEVVEMATAGRVQAVRLADGRRVQASTVILAMPPAKAAALVAEGQQPTLADWAGRAVPVRAATLDIGLRRLPRPDAWFAVGLEEPLYLSVHSKWAQLAPEGGALIHVMRYLGNEPRGGADTERQLEGLLDLAQPGWRDEVVVRRFMPDLTVSGALPSVAWEQRDGPRGPAVPGAPGLFVAGDWVGPAGMLADRALVSGAAAGAAAASLPLAGGSDTLGMAGAASSAPESPHLLVGGRA
jgi:phytoene dehydrogenase-like protein